MEPWMILVLIVIVIVLVAVAVILLQRKRRSGGIVGSAPAPRTGDDQ